MNKEEKVLKEILLTAEEIQKLCAKLGKQITDDYSTKEPAIFLGLLKGCHPFMSDLLKHVDLKLEIDYMDVSSFFGGVKSTGEVQIIKDLTTEVKGRDIIIVEDIVDSGRTIKKIKDLLLFRGAKSIEIVTLIDKPSGRTVDLVPRYIGKKIEDCFIMGYGLDYEEYYRNLNCIGIPKDELIK